MNIDGYMISKEKFLRKVSGLLEFPVFTGDYDLKFHEPSK